MHLEHVRRAAHPGRRAAHDDDDVTGLGGLVPPQYLVDQYAAQAEAGQLTTEARTDDDERLAAEFLSRVESDPVASRIFGDFAAEEDAEAMAIVDDTSTDGDIIEFQQSIFLQDRVILKRVKEEEKTKGGIINMLEVNVNCGFGYDINCEVVCENGVVNLPCPSFPTVRYANEVSTKIEDNWILRFIDSYDVELQDWVDHALKGETGGSSAWDGYVASITADALVKSQTSGVPEKVVTGGTPDFYKK